MKKLKNALVEEFVNLPNREIWLENRKKDSVFGKKRNGFDGEWRWYIREKNLGFFKVTLCIGSSLSLLQRVYEFTSESRDAQWSKMIIFRSHFKRFTRRNTDLLYKSPNFPCNLLTLCIGSSLSMFPRVYEFF